MSVIDFKHIPGFSRYIARSDGTVWSHVSVDRWRCLRGEPRKGDRRVRLALTSDDGKLVRKYRSYFVLLTFAGPKPDGCECLHRNGDCTDDRPSNLRWGTSKENKDDMLRHGTRRHGDQIHTCKLSEQDIRDIRMAGYPLRPLAKKYSVTETLISLILRRKVWKHV